MKQRYFNDVKAGDRFKSATYLVSEDAIVAFAREFDPQRLHVDVTAAKGMRFKGLIASGWQTAAITMRLFVQTLAFAKGAIGLGVDKLRWPNPVRPGDALTVETKILKVRPSRSKQNYGLIRLRNVTTNQYGETVQTMLATIMVSRRRLRHKATRPKATRERTADYRPQTTRQQGRNHHERLCED